MITTVLVVVVVAALVMAYVRRRPARRVAPGEGGPRTVADLVRLRAEQAEGARHAAPAAAVGPPVDAPGRAVVQPMPESAGSGSDGPAPDPVAVEPVVLDPGAVEPVVVEPGSNGTRPAGDSPWTRAARIAESDGTVWSTAPSLPAEPVAVAAAAVGPDRPSRPPGLMLRPVDLPQLVDVRTVVPAVPPQPPVPSRGVVMPEPPVPPQARAAPHRPVPPRSVVAPQLPAPPQAPVPPARVRLPDPRRPAEAEESPVDLALHRTFGADPATQAGAAPVVSMSDATPGPVEPEVGPAGRVTFRVVGRDGRGIAAARVTLLDDRGGQAAVAVAGVDGRGVVRAPRPGSFMLVSAAAGHQPGVVAVAVAGAPVDAEVLLARSASLSGTVCGEGGPVVGAHLRLEQDGEIVDDTETGPAGEYRIEDLAAGEYSLAVAAAEYEPAVAPLTVPAETDLRHDVDLEPTGLPGRDPTAADRSIDDDVMAGRH